MPTDDKLPTNEEIDKIRGVVSHPDKSSGEKEAEIRNLASQNAEIDAAGRARGDALSQGNDDHLPEKDAIPAADDDSVTDEQLLLSDRMKTRQK